MSQDASAVERQVLASWKEVAGFLRVTVRTVQRWERRRGLPVHRFGSGPNARIVAYTDELTNWLELHDRFNGSTLDGAGEREGGSRASSRWRLLGFAAALLAIVGGILAVVWWTPPGPAVRWRIDKGLFVTIDERGRVCWQREIRDLRPQTYTADGHLSMYGAVPGEYEGILHQDVDGDGADEWLINVVPPPLDEERGRLICLSEDGQPRWEFAFGSAQHWRGRSLSSNYVGLTVRPISVAEKRYILTVANHAIWFPCQVALLDPKTGRILEQYWHPGGLFRARIYDIDNDAHPELLLAGVNNPGQGLGHPALVVLRLPFSRAGHRQSSESSDFWLSSEGREIGYVLFARPDTFDTVGYVPVPDTLAVVEGRHLLMRVTRPGEGSLFYYLDFSLRLVECRITEGVIATHKRLRAAGQLDHDWTQAEEEALSRVQTFPAAPDGNSPEVARFWEF